MKKPSPDAPFGEKSAASYDQRFAKLAPMKAALHLMAHLALEPLGLEARILCVGVGTGAELLYLGKAFPGWRFVGVEPSGPMLAQCRGRLEDAGLSERVELHEGYLDSLPATAPFDGATSILVSHFLLEAEQRRAYFGGIAQRLRPGGLLVSAAMAADPAPEAYGALVDLWVRSWVFAEMPEKRVQGFKPSIGKGLALFPPAEIEQILSDSGFAQPVQIYQALLMHGWVARRGI